jgi:hypothetical protein
LTFESNDAKYIYHAAKDSTKCIRASRARGL